MARLDEGGAASLEERQPCELARADVLHDIGTDRWAQLLHDSLKRAPCAVQVSACSTYVSYSNTYSRSDYHLGHARTCAVCPRDTLVQVEPPREAARDGL